LGLVLGAITDVLGIFCFSKKEEQRNSRNLSPYSIGKIKSVCKLITVEGDFAEIYRLRNTKERLFFFFFFFCFFFFFFFPKCW